MSKSGENRDAYKRPVLIGIAVVVVAVVAVSLFTPFLGRARVGKSHTIWPPS